jgi:hypothetical protein
MKLLLPAFAIGAVALVGLAFCGHVRHERSMKKMHVPRPLTHQELVHRYRMGTQEYIMHSALDPREAVHKWHLVSPAVAEHCHRHVSHLLMRGASPHEIQQKCIAIAEKICQQLHIQMKPRCSWQHRHHHPWGHPGGQLSDHIGGLNHAGHKSYAVNIYELNYNHAPTPNLGGRLF